MLSPSNALWYLLWYLLRHLAECNDVNAFTILEKKDNMQV